MNALYTAKINSEHSNGALTAMEFAAPRNFAPPLHRHDLEDELFYLIEGELWFSCGDVEPCSLPALWCGCRVVSRTPSRSAPRQHGCSRCPPQAQFERFVATLGRPAEQPVIPEPEEIDPGHVAEICRQFSIEVLGPPPEPVRGGYHMERATGIEPA